MLEMTDAEQQSATSTESEMAGKVPKYIAAELPTTVGRGAAMPSLSLVTEMMAMPLPTSLSSASSVSFGTQQATRNKQPFL